MMPLQFIDGQEENEFNIHNFFQSSSSLPALVIHVLLITAIIVY